MKDISLVRFLPIQPKVPFINLRMFAAVLSALAIMASVYLFATRGLNYGIDFTGGTVIEIDTGQAPASDNIRSPLNALGLGDVALQNIAPQSDEVKHDYLRITLPIQAESPEREYELSLATVEAVAKAKGAGFAIKERISTRENETTFLVDLGREPTNVDLRSEISTIDGPRPILDGSGINDLVITKAENPAGGNSLVRITVPKTTGNGANVQQVSLGLVKATLEGVVGDFDVRDQGVVGSQVSGELRKKGALAVGLALLMVLAYIWFRFEWQFGMGAVLALFHDVVLTIGVFSFTQIEFNLSIIAAILTIVGYSLNDTVIVYDRIRENLRKFKKMPLPDILNLSINDTLSRTILTSVTTLLALVALYVLGGSGLRGFSFAMIWGVFVGTYSSIFVASPLLMLLKLQRGTNTGGVPAEV